MIAFDVMLLLFLLIGLSAGKLASLALTAKERTKGK